MPPKKAAKSTTKVARDKAAREKVATEESEVPPKKTASEKVTTEELLPKRASSCGKLEQLTCVLCCQKIIESKEQALHCDETCKGWIHLYCASVSLAHFESLCSESSTKSFMCMVCMQCAHEDAVDQLRSEVVSLRRQFEQTQHNAEIEQLWSEVLSLRLELA